MSGEQANPLYEEKRFGFTFQVWPNRIESSEGAFASLAKTNVLPVKQISGVTIAGMSRKLQITMNDGKAHQFQLRHADKARDAILSLL